MPNRLPTWNTASLADLRDFARIRILALDLDGTLFPSDTQNVFLNIKKLANSTLLRRLSFVIATGRTFRGVRSLLQQWPATADSPMILYNGSVIINPKSNRLEYIRTIPLTTVETILHLCRTYRQPILAYFCRSHPAPICGYPTEEVYGWTHGSQTKTEFNGLPVRWQSHWHYAHETEPTACLVNTQGTNAVIFAKCLRACSTVDVTTSGGSFLEIRPRGSNKAVSLSRIATDVGLSAERVLAIGDNDNDAEMLRWAGIGVAVSAASQTALASADYVSHYGVAQGVLETLRLIRNARRYYGDPILATPDESSQ